MTRHVALPGMRPGLDQRDPFAALANQWKHRGLCARRYSRGPRQGQLVYNPDMWFPTEGEGYRRPKAICAACPVTAECLAWAMDNETSTSWARFGMYGGLTPDQRADLAKETP